MINPKNLKKSILDYAIRGELSAKFRRENADNTTAFDEIATYNAKITQIKGQRETLLLQIEKQHKSEKNAHRKARLKTLSGNLKAKIKSYRTITPLNQNAEFTPPFEIPNSWAWVKLGEICEASGSNLAMKDLTGKDGKFPIFGASGFIQNVNFYHKANKCIGIVKDGAGVGRVFILPEKSSVLATMQYIEPLNIIDLQWFAKMLISLDLSSYSAGTTIPHIYFRDYQNEIIPLPPLAEQQFIAGQLEQALTACEQYESTVNALLNLEDGLFNKISKSVLDYAIHGELSAQYRRKNQTAVASNTISGSLNDENHHPNCHCETCQKASRGNLPTTENQANDYNDNGIATTATQSRNDGVLTAFDEIAAYNAKITQIKGQRETLLLQIEKQHKSEKNAHRKARLKTLSGSLKAKIKSYRTITPLNQNAEFTPPFEIPNSWAWVKLGEICEITSGGTPSKNIERFWQNGTIKWASVRDMNTDFIENTELKITKEALGNSTSNIVPKNSLIIATRVGLGKVCIAKDDIAINQDLKGISCKFVFLNYLFLFFKKSADFILESGTGTTVKGVKLDFIENLPIPLPPLAEQRFIAEKLEKLLDLCKKLKTKP